MNKIALFSLIKFISTFSSILTQISTADTNTIERLQDGKYIACTRQKPLDAHDFSKVCFSFMKQGKNIKGAYKISQPDGVSEDATACIAGVIKDRALIGYVYFNSAKNGIGFEEIGKIRSELPRSQPIALTTNLQIAEGKIDIFSVGANIKTDPHNYSARVTYVKSRLDLTKFNYVSSLKSDIGECSS
jgi:hypothetical protein